MKSAPFRYLRAGSLEEALVGLEEEDSKVLAGGQSLLPMLNLRLVRPSSLVDIGQLGELRQHSFSGGVLSVGALTTHRDMSGLRGPAELAGLRALRTAAGLIGHHPIRVRGTVGGSVAHADPAAEWPLLTLVTGAVIEVQSSRGQRTIEASQFYRGLFETALRPEEMVIAVRFRCLGDVTSIEEYAARAGDFAAAVAAASLTVEGGAVRAARIAVGGVASTPLLLNQEAGVLVGARTHDRSSTADLAFEVGESCARAVSPSSDLHASDVLRRRLVRSLVVRAVQRCFAQERGRSGEREIAS